MCFSCQNTHTKAHTNTKHNNKIPQKSQRRSKGQKGVVKKIDVFEVFC